MDVVFAVDDRQQRAGPDHKRGDGESDQHAARAVRLPDKHPLVVFVAGNFGKTLGHYLTEWGQLPLAVIVIDGHVVAVEDIEGTDALLARIARLREQGRIRAAPRRGVLVKVPKRGQDLRFDLPTIGPRTVEGAVKAELAGIAVAAGDTIVAEPQAMIEKADAGGIFVTGVAG